MPAVRTANVGRKLVAAAIAFAELHQKAPVYLECHDGNVRFYEKMGFTNEKRYEIQEKDPAEGALALHYNSMVYSMS